MHCIDSIGARLALASDAQTGAAFEQAAATWDAGANTRRLHDRDASLWTARDEAAWLGWLAAPSPELSRSLDTFAADTRAAGFAHAVLLGMGGSSLAPEVLAQVFGSAQGHPALTILDTTDPAQIRRISRAVDLANAQVLVASKSGGTVETNLLLRHALAAVRSAPRQVVAITDPGSSLESLARERGFPVFRGEPTIGGRFSALSAFGLLPAAAIGLDVRRLLASADAMRARCRSAAARDNPGVALGLAIGTMAAAGRDKLTFDAAPALASFPAWIEQLVAESLGKHGRGIVPVDTRSGIAACATDRLLVSLRLASDPAPTDAQIDIALDDRYVLGGEFLRWEIATAVAGSLLGVNPFDQPDVEAAKVAARALMAGSAESGTDGPVGVDARDLRARLAAHFDSMHAGDYIAMLAFVDRDPFNERALRALCTHLAETRGAAATLGFGPRYLHSTGQLHKGGPNRGVFLFITCAEAHDLPVPGEPMSFGRVKLAQARGDINVLRERGRRVLHVHLGTDVRAGLQTLADALR